MLCYGIREDWEECAASLQPAGSSFTHGSGLRKEPEIRFGGRGIARPEVKP